MVELPSMGDRLSIPDDKRTGSGRVSVHCPHCHKQATAVRAFFLADGSEFYCGNCGWNVGKATTSLRIATWAMWGASAVGVVLAALALKGSWGAEGALLVAIPFVLLPFASGIVTRFRLSKITVSHVDAKALSVAAATEDDRIAPDDFAFAARPRAVRLTNRGYLYSLGMALVTVFVLWLLSFGVRGLASPSSGNKIKSVFAVVVWTVCLWSCISFYRNRFRERRLLANGELSRGMIATQSNTQLGSRIVYIYNDGNGKRFQNRSTDFSKKLYEEMPIHVFYDPQNSSESAVFEGSLFQFR
jgi:hypothetical protein